MDGGALLFKQPIPFITEMEGTVNGQTFTVKGRGQGDATQGTIEAKFICTSGKLPVPWPSILTTLSYGAECFAQYGVLKDFFKSCMPEGYVQERTINFEGESCFKTRAEVTYENGSLYNRVKLTGEGFKRNGNILGQQYEYYFNPHCIYIMPDKPNGGISSRFNIVHNTVEGGHQIADHIQHNTPLNGGVAIIPEYHHLTVHTVISKDESETRDHMVLVETFTAIDCNKLYL